ncbi:electron transfer flavoprotein subunit alpha/FixB family protein [Chloroflexota bacterium]
MTDNIWVFAELDEGEFTPVVVELLSEANRLKSSIGGEVEAVVLAGTERLPQLSLLREYGADNILLVHHDCISERNPEVYVQVLAEAVHQYEPRLVLVGETPVSSQLARRLVARLGASFVTDYTRIQSQGNSLLVTRLVYSGKVGATIRAFNRPLIATLKPGVMRVEKPRTPGMGEVKELVGTVIPRQKHMEVIERLPADPESMELSEADIVVGAGKGLGSDDNFALLQEMARELKAKVGGTRRAVDMGWISSEELLGQTGKIIAPRLYIAAGVSGASHHIAGIRDANLKVAINTDRNAPIFTLSDLGVIGDVRQVLTALIRGIKAVNKSDRSEASEA